MGGGSKRKKSNNNNVNYVFWPGGEEIGPASRVPIVLNIEKKKLAETRAWLMKHIGLAGQKAADNTHPPTALITTTPVCMCVHLILYVSACQCVSVCACVSVSW